MSSTYRILCLSHDPAFELDTEWQSGHDGRLAIEGALARPVEGHERCDLIGGRYSYPLVEVYCPPQRPDSGHPFHTDGRWVDVEWLNVLYRAYRVAERPEFEDLRRKLAQVRCWPPDRLNRLRHHLEQS